MDDNADDEVTEFANFPPTDVEVGVRDGAWVTVLGEETVIGPRPDGSAEPVGEGLFEALRKNRSYIRSFNQVRYFRRLDDGSTEEVLTVR